MYLKLNNGSTDGYIFTYGNMDQFEMTKPIIPQGSLFYLDANITDSVCNRTPYLYEELSMDGNTAVAGNEDLRVEIRADCLFAPRNNGKIKFENFLDDFDIVVGTCFDWDGQPFDKRSTLFSLGGLDGNGMPDSYYEFTCSANYSGDMNVLTIRIGNRTYKTFSPLIGKNNLIVLSNQADGKLYIKLNDDPVEEFDATGYKQPRMKRFLSVGGYHNNSYGDIQMGFGNNIYNFYIGKYNSIWELNNKPNEDFINLVFEKNWHFDYDEISETKPIPHTYVSTTDCGCVMFGNYELTEIIE